LVYQTIAVQKRNPGNKNHYGNYVPVTKKRILMNDAFPEIHVSNVMIVNWINEAFLNICSKLYVKKKSALQAD
jgi:hypothetical protein